MDVGLELVDYALGLKFSDLPEKVVERVKQSILDTFGCVIDGSNAQGTDALVGMVRDWGGKPESSLLVFGDKVPTPHAALVNCSMGRAHDYDDFHENAMVHTGAGIIPACMAVAEHAGRVSGKDFITAAALGIDIMARLGLSLKRNFLTTGMSVTPQVGTFASALVAGKLMRMERKEMAHALGISYSLVAGNIMCSIEGTMMVHIQIGLSSQGGIVSALMAQRGIDGPQGVFQGKFGYFPVYQQNEYDPSVITRNLGKQFEVTNITTKYYPCCLCSHAAIAATLQLVGEEKIDPRGIEQIRVGVNQGSYNMVCQPLEQKRNPTSFKAALFSLPYGVASALVRGHVSLEDFTPEAIQDGEVRSVANKVGPFVDPDIERQHGRNLGPAVVEVIMKTGAKRSRRVDFVKGSPQNPMTMAEYEEKFRKCVSFSGRQIGAEKASAFITAVKELDTLDDVSRIVDYLR